MSSRALRFWNGWRERAVALKNIPALLGIVWASGRGVVAGGLGCRLAAALLPISMLAVAKQIFDGVQRQASGGELPPEFWWLVGLEFGLAAFGALLGRAIGFFDALLTDRFTRHVSVRVLAHASKLDLESYEDPNFYDKLERARVQATDRIAMIQAMGAALQQFVAALTLSLSILYFSPWLLALLILAVVPALIGESHFAFLGYSLNTRQTPVRRELDYLRVLGASKESAKELKLFGLAPFVTGRYSDLSDQLYRQNIDLSRRRLWAGAWLSLLSTASYYAAYAYVIYR
ncbi:MAG: ABC transporter ATP-binding protein, partial [Acidobacteria bacterium]|nr:ABC transporter ATP-binding protein [Acidobacteriota bacterium]